VFDFGTKRAEGRSTRRLAEFLEAGRDAVAPALELTRVHKGIP
jgi:hypothetical protein